MLRFVAAAIAVGALVVCAGPAVAEGLGDSVVTFVDSVDDGAAMSTDALGDSGTTSTNRLNDRAATSADAPNDGAASASDGLGDNVATSVEETDGNIEFPPAASRHDSRTTAAGDLDNDVTTAADGLNDSRTASAEETDDDIAVTPAASPYSSAATAAGLALSLIRLGTKALALTVVPLHQFPAFDAVITHESGWDVFAINPESGAYGLGQALPADKMRTHGADWRFNPLTQLRWTYDYMNERYGGPDGAWAFWQRHHWY
ncbi:transglycosylase SLT domain-containing protein [Nocardia sp. NPDC049707]|uniref:aggregation-promoting factor C-terminal-like domain-containing protein n=1 Tax=Nocardia sp. NPDC049707 TaxID=3154735 RepID=UPI003435970F